MQSRNPRIEKCIGTYNEHVKQVKSILKRKQNNIYSQFSKYLFLFSLIKVVVNMTDVFIFLKVSKTLEIKIRMLI